MSALQKILGASLLLLSSQISAQSDINERSASDPLFAPVEHQYLIFPMVEKDFWHWGAQGSAVFLENKAVISPEASGRKGLIHTTQPNTKKNHWMAIMDFTIGRDKVKEMNKNGDGLSVYYLRHFDSGNPNNSENFYGHVDDFDGIGIFINTLQTEGRNNEKSGTVHRSKRVNISSFANNGRRVLKQKTEGQECFREVTGSHLHFSKL